jgi:hypothetical protein
MIKRYERRAALYAALAAYSEDADSRRRYAEAKLACEILARILRRLKENQTGEL